MCAGGAGGIDLGPGRHRAFFISLLVRHVRDLPPQLEDGSCRARREGEGLQNIEDVIHGVLLPWLERRPHADTAGASMILRHESPSFLHGAAFVCRLIVTVHLDGRPF